MSFNNILGHDDIKTYLKNALAQKRISHAYIFTGRAGIGKKMMAREFAKALLCTGAGEKPCDTCKNCRMIDHDNHPDVNLIAPDASKKAIPIEAIRTLQQALAFKNLENQWKIHIIDDADKLSIEASNCLLKTFEEPPDWSLIILVTSNEGMLPATILSRGHTLFFKPLTASELDGFLGADAAVEPDKKDFLIRLADGSIGRLTSLLEEGIYERKKEIIERLCQLQIRDNFDLANLAAQSRGNGSANRRFGSLQEARTRITEFLEFLPLFYRDVLIYRQTRNADSIYNHDQADIVAELAGRLDERRIEKIVDVIHDAMYYIQANVDMSLVLETMFYDIAKLYTL